MNPRSALITGAAGGLGQALVRRLAQAGWRVFAADLEAPATDLPGVLHLRMDVTSTASIASALEHVREQSEGLDAIVNFAGVLVVGAMVDIDESRLARILDVNVMGTYRVNQAFFPLVEATGGRIVNMSSETGWETTAPFNGPYAMSKYAIEAYSHALRRELALLGVRVITIQPGAFRTDMVEQIEAAFTTAQRETERFDRVIAELKGVAAKEIESAHDPDLLARVVENALTTSRPKPVYSVKPDRRRTALERLPLRAADKVWLSVLRRATRDDS